MASIKTITRLHAVAQQPVKSDKLSDSQADVSMLAMAVAYWQRPARRQFGRAKNAVDAPALASTMSATAPPDRGHAFAALAQRDQIRSMLARHAARGGHDQYRGDVQM